MRVGVDLGGTKIEALVLEGEREIRGRARRPTPEQGGAEAVVAAVVGTIEDAAAAAGTAAGALEIVGIGSPGRVDSEAGTVAQASNLAGGWQKPFPFAAAVETLVGAPVRIGNDVAVAVDAEVALGAGHELRSFVAIWWGTGVGGAVVLDGRRWRGASGASELGHMIVKLGGRRCGCGRRGCVEAYAGRAAMEQRARRKHQSGQATKLFKLAADEGRDRLTSGVWKKALAHGDGVARELLDEAYAALGAVAASCINLLGVDGIVLGGGLGTRFGDEAARRLREAMAPHLFFTDRDPRVLPAALGDDGGAIGAALAAQLR